MSSLNGNGKSASSGLDDAEKGKSGGRDTVKSNSSFLRSRKQRSTSTTQPSSTARDDDETIGRADGEAEAAGFPGYWGRPWSQRSTAYQFMPFRGMYYDVKGRLPYYANDWIEGLKPKNIYRVAAASIRMYFINLLPAIGKPVPDMPSSASLGYARKAAPDSH